MNIDWPIALGIFLILTTWSFAYYNTFFKETTRPLEDVVGDVADRIMDYLLIDVYEIPTMANSSNTTTNSVLYFNFTWPFGQNSTRVFWGDSFFACNVTANALYWRANLAIGANHFRMRYFNRSVPMNCTTSIVPDGNETSVIPWAQEKYIFLSKSKMLEMMATDYDGFRNSLDINRNFRVELNVSNNITIYGLNSTDILNVYFTERWNKLEETNENVNVKFFVW